MIAPKDLRVGFAFDRKGTHTFALGWQLDSTRKTIRYHLEFSVDRKNFHRLPPEICVYAVAPEKRVDVSFSDFVLFMETLGLNIRDHRDLYWRVVAEFHDKAGQKVFEESVSNVAVFEMPELM